MWKDYLAYLLTNFIACVNFIAISSFHGSDTALSKHLVQVIASAIEAVHWTRYEKVLQWAFFTLLLAGAGVMRAGVITRAGYTILYVD